MNKEDFDTFCKRVRKCQHEHWQGIPEVDAFCQNPDCGLDEFQVHKENELLMELYNLYYHE